MVTGPLTDNPGSTDAGFLAVSGGSVSGTGKISPTEYSFSEIGAPAIYARLPVLYDALPSEL